MKNDTDPIQRKSRSMSGGVNVADKSQLKKLAKLVDRPDIPRVPIGKLYMRLKGTWVYKGTFCRLCSSTMNDSYVIDNHHYICEVNKQKQHKSLDD